MVQFLLISAKIGNVDFPAHVIVACPHRFIMAVASRCFEDPKELHTKPSRRFRSEFWDVFLSSQQKEPKTLKLRFVLHCTPVISCAQLSLDSTSVSAGASIRLCEVSPRLVAFNLGQAASGTAPISRSIANTSNYNRNKKK